MAAIGMPAAERAHPVAPGNGMQDVPGMAQAADVPDGLWYAAKRRVLGPPLVTEQLRNERLSRRIRLHGVVGIGGDGRPTMVNPRYELLR